MVKNEIDSLNILLEREVRRARGRAGEGKRGGTVILEKVVHTYIVPIVQGLEF